MALALRAAHREDPWPRIRSSRKELKPWDGRGKRKGSAGKGTTFSLATCKRQGKGLELLDGTNEGSTTIPLM